MPLILILLPGWYFVFSGQPRDETKHFKTDKNLNGGPNNS